MGYIIPAAKRKHLICVNPSSSVPRVDPLMRVALYEPDIPQNTGTIMRTAACLGVAVDLIEPCGFVVDDRRFRRAAMDYLNTLEMERHVSWNAFRDAQRSRAGRLVLLTTRSETPYIDFRFRTGDVLMVGRESSGVPQSVHAAVDASVVVPMIPGSRSLNVAVAAAMVLGEALRQTGGPGNLAP